MPDYNKFLKITIAARSNLLQVCNSLLILYFSPLFRWFERLFLYDQFLSFVAVAKVPQFEGSGGLGLDNRNRHSGRRLHVILYLIFLGMKLLWEYMLSLEGNFNESKCDDDTRWGLSFMSIPVTLLLLHTHLILSLAVIHVIIVHAFVTPGKFRKHRRRTGSGEHNGEALRSCCGGGHYV